MRRIEPRDFYYDLPCSVVSIGCAAESIIGKFEYGKIKQFSDRASENDNYASLSSVNVQIRNFFPVKKYTYFTRVQRKPLFEWFREKTCERAIVCVYGHFIYTDKDTYYSFFDNDADKVVAVWELA